MAKAEQTDILDLGSWFILRMGSRQTLTICEELTDRGYEVWTPTSQTVKRRPRTRKEYDKAFALMPSYVFAHVRHLDDLMRLAMLPDRNVPRFTLFRLREGFPLIADQQLDALRREEARMTRIYEKHKAKGQKSRTFEAGGSVRVAEGDAFGGMIGVVEGTRGQFTLVSFPGFHQPIQIASLLLTENVAAEGKSDSDTAAQAA